MRVELRAIDSIRPYDKNPRLNDAAVDAVAKSIQSFGFRQPLVIDKDGQIIVGHTRYKAALKLGMTQVPCHIAEELTPAQAKAYRLADNKTAELAAWDFPLLKIELDDLKLLDIDLADLGFDKDELLKICGPGEGLTDPDVVPEAPAIPVTKPGDLWLLGEHRLLCGDSTKAADVARLMNSERAQMMFADPPYGVDYEGGRMNKRLREKLAGDDSTDIYGQFLPVVLLVVDGPCYLWFAGNLGRGVFDAVEDSGGEISTLLIWHKTNATYAAMYAQYKPRHEPCLYFKPHGSTLRWVGPSDACSLWEFNKEGINKLHPTQKPVALVANALRNHKAATVLDPFVGSGTTIIAAEQLGRKCYAMEIEPRYVDVAVRRWEEFTGKKAQLEEACVGATAETV